MTSLYHLSQTFYQAPDFNYTGRKDSLPKERLFQVIKKINLFTQEMPAVKVLPKSIALLGFCCDEGVKRNLGRVGAKEGPRAIRAQLGNLPTHFLSQMEFYDMGDIICPDEFRGDSLREAQLQLAYTIENLVRQKYLPIILGGGHETAWGHYQGLYKANPHCKIGIINFDAHFDLRPMVNNFSTSGTPFTQIADHCKKENKSFNYFCLGIQKQANTALLWKTAARLNVKYFFAETMQEKNWENHSNLLQDFINKVDGIYLTFCLDVMAEAFAPGVSAPQPSGLIPQQIWPYLQLILQSKKVMSFDIVELLPKCDRDEMTAKLAANIIFYVLDFRET